MQDFQEYGGISGEVRGKFGENVGGDRGELGKTAREIIELIRQDKFVTIPEMARNVRVSSRTIEKQLAKLKGNEIIERVGPDKEGYWEIRS